MTKCPELGELLGYKGALGMRGAPRWFAQRAEVDERIVLGRKLAQLRAVRRHDELVAAAHLRQGTVELSNPARMKVQFRLFDAYVTFVRAMAGKSPLVVVLDDLHWADKPTLLLLQHLARAPVGRAGDRRVRGVPRRPASTLEPVTHFGEPFDMTAALSS